MSIMMFQNFDSKEITEELMESECELLRIRRFVVRSVQSCSNVQVLQFRKFKNGYFEKVL